MKTDWEKVKKGYEKGFTDSELADTFKLKIDNVRVHRNRHKWGPANKAKRRYKNPRNSHKNDTSNNRNVTDPTQPIDQIASSARLTPKQRLFCEYYAYSGNAYQSYIKAYDSSLRVAQVNAAKVQNSPKVMAYINDLRRRQAKRLELTADMFINDLVKQARSDISDYINWRTVKTQRKDEDGNPAADAQGQPIYDYQVEIWPKDLDEVDTSIVTSVSKGRDGFKVDLPDKQKALLKLVEILPESTEHTQVNNTFIEALKADNSTQDLFKDHTEEYQHKTPDDV